MKAILYRFGPFVLNPAERVLRRNGVLVPLAPKVFSTLHVLVAGGGRVISKEDLLSAVWPDSFVEDGNLTQNISVLRKILGGDFGRGSIETIARIGYRFCPGVETEDAPESAAPFSLHDGELPASEPPAVEEHRSPTEVPAIAGSLPRRRRTDLIVPLPIATKTANTPGRWSWILLCALALLGIGIEVRAALHARTSAQDANDFTLTRLTTKASEDAVTAAAISPNGRWVAYADADGVVLQTIRDSGTHTVRAPAMQKADALAWFPDGLHLLLSGEEPSGKPALWVLSVTEDAPLLLREAARLGVPAPDGSAVAFTTEDKSEIWTASAVGENPRRLIAGSPGNTFGAIAWSKNSRTLLLNRHTAIPAEEHPAPDSDEALHGFHSAYLAADASTGVVTATVDGVRFDSACLPQDDELLFSRSERTDEYDGSASLWKVKLDTGTGMFDSPPVKVKEIPQFHILTLSIAESGDVVVILRQSWLDVNVGSLRSPGPGLDDVRRLSLDDGVAYPHAWTPDSESVLYESNRSGHFQIYKQRLDRHDPEAIVTTASPQMLPHMSPDHRWILFANDELDHSSSSLFRVSPQGGTPLSVAANLGADYRCPQEGTICVIRTNDAHGRAIYSALDPVNGKGRKLFLAPQDWGGPGDWDISSDGSTLAAIFPQSPAPLIRTVAISTGSAQTVPLHIAAPIMSINWAADQKGWFVAASTLAAGDMYYIDLHGAATLLRRTTGPTWGVPSPDGHKLAFVNQSVDSNVWLLHPNRGK